MEIRVYGNRMQEPMQMEAVLSLPRFGAGLSWAEYGNAMIQRENEMRAEAEQQRAIANERWMKARIKADRKQALCDEVCGNLGLVSG